jgi:putative drug exporter of the RND superfamily
MSSFLYRLGQRAARRRWITVGIWIVAVFTIFAVGNALGGKLVDDFNLPDSESQRAYDLLAERYPTASGTSAFIVFHAVDGPLDAQADSISSSMDAIAGQPHVVTVTDPLEGEGPSRPMARSGTHR